MTIRKSVFLLGIALVTLFSGFKNQDTCNPITSAELKTMLQQLGYEVKDIEASVGKEKYSITMTTGGLDIPIALELSSSTKYIWLTVYLAMADASNGSKSFGLLQQNGLIQPSQFYITSSGKLMIGLPVENKAVSNAVLREKLDLLSSKVNSTKSYWQ